MIFSTEPNLKPEEAKEFENGDFTLKTLQTFSIHTTLEKFENTTIALILHVFEYNSVREITRLMLRHCLRKASFSK